MEKVEQEKATGIHHRAKREEVTGIDHRAKCAKMSRIYHRALIPAVFLLALLYIGVSRITETQLFGGIFLLSVPAIYGFIRKNLFGRLLHSSHRGLFLCLLLVIAVSHLSSLAAVFRGEIASVSMMKLLYYDIVMTDALYLALEAQEDALVGMKLLWGILLASAVYGFLQYLAGSFQARMTGGELPRTDNLYANAIPAGVVYLIGFWLSSGVEKKWLRTLSQLLFALVLITTLSRSSWLGLLLTGVLQFFLEIRDRRQAGERILPGRKTMLLTAAAVAVMMLILYRLGLFQPILSRFHFRSQNTIAYERRVTYAQHAIHHLLGGVPFWQFLFGRGVLTSRAYVVTLPTYEPGYEFFENSYITTLYEFGALTLLIVVGMIVYFLVQCVQRGKDRYLLYAVLGASVAFYFYDTRIFTEVTFPLLFCGCLGLSSRHRKGKSRE